MVHIFKMMISPGNFFIFLVFIFWTVRRMKEEKMAQNENNYVTCHIITCIIAYDHNFWYTIVKGWYLQLFFSFFKNFDFLGCLGDKRAKNSPKWKKQLHPLCTISQEQYSIWSWFLGHLRKMMISGSFFHFFKILIFRLVV